jgi:N,N'-diacetyllegionaminate synthase
MQSSTLIIAEAGVNHNGDFELAKNLIDVAADAGADIVKFQTFNAEKLTTQYANKAGYQKINSKVEESQYEMLRRLEINFETHEKLISHCVSRNIEFLSTGFDVDSVDLLVSLGLNIFKIPSGEITNLQYLRHIGSFAKTVILSTGMATLAEVKKALNVLEESGTKRSNITILHCTSAYPALMADVNLKAMLTIASELDVSVGYSDHTLGYEVAIAAVSLGAKVIEKHFTLNKNLPGPDHKASLEPTELKEMVMAIRNIEKALGNGVKEPTSIELENRSVVRKSIVANTKINNGEIFTPDNITTKRPGIGISPMYWDELIGQKATRDFEKDEMITL